jgi:hypothetical protein
MYFDFRNRRINFAPQQIQQLPGVMITQIMAKDAKEACRVIPNQSRGKRIVFFIRYRDGIDVRFMPMIPRD